MPIPGSSGPRTALPLLALALAGCAASTPAVAPAPAPAAPVAPSGSTAGATSAPITAQDLRTRVFIVAHDSMRGRMTGEPGVRKAADYLVRELTRLGVRPAGDSGSYLARVPLVRRSTAARITARTSPRETTLGRDDVLLLSGLSDVPASPRPTGEGPIVFGGYQADPTIGSAQELRPEQLRGSVLIVRFGAAPGTNPTSARFNLGELFSPASPLAALILVNEGGPLQQAWDYLRSSGGTMQLDTGAPQAAAGGGPPVFLISAAAAERLIGGPLAQARAPRTGVGTLRYQITEDVQRVEAWNVVGVIPGSDPARSGEYVAVGAHYDHIGVGDPVNGDSINNGADDDGSGTSAVLEIAERYAGAAGAQRPARSLLFVWHTGEEEGLLGSEWFT
ncbi:MAG TPA: M28 family peptidase, partial [Longimicrobiaceae bacterium]|nr:M28 family peptidase [Longimicrobiaceae bacterium]